ncbi:TIGR02281 family clan AA aspartic protease [Dongia sp.]|uniref:retropepsin-like aspartic protease family protein n=1 Tax=Dongia sp. TaxID=1977262 RepID=UPI003753CFE9
MHSRWIWLLVVAVLIGVVALAAKVAPGGLNDDDSRMQLIYLCLILAVLTGGLAARLQARPGTTLAHLGTWGVIFAALILIYSYRDQFGGLGDRFAAELVPAKGTETGPASIAFQAEADGHYHVYGAIDGSSVRFMVDSGATSIVISPDDARMLGMQPEYLNYTMAAETANGTVRVAPVQLKTLKVGPIVMHDIPATVTEAEMPFSLLGMEFLRRLKSWGVKNGRLTFEQ